MREQSGLFVVYYIILLSINKKIGKNPGVTGYDV